MSTSNQPLSTTDAKGFLAGLFDFSFTTFVTLKFLKVIYGLLVALIMLMGLIFAVIFMARGGVSVFVGLVIVPAVTLLYLVFARVSLEAVALFFRIGENTSIMAAALGRQAGGPSAAGAMPAPGGPPSPASPVVPTASGDEPQAPAAGGYGPPPAI